MPTATVATGYKVERTAWGWGHILHEECGKWTSFVDPTDEKVRWYMRMHRCGPVDGEWHSREAGPSAQRPGSPMPTAAWMRAVSHYVGTRPTELFENSTVWPAVEELAHTLRDRFPAAFGGRTS